MRDGDKDTMDIRKATEEVTGATIIAEARVHMMLLEDGTVVMAAAETPDREALDIEWKELPPLEALFSAYDAAHVAASQVLAEFNDRPGPDTMVAVNGVTNAVVEALMKLEEANFERLKEQGL